MEASGVFPGGRVFLETADPADPVVTIDYRGERAELFVNTNLLKLGTRLNALEGVVVHAAATGRVYLPLQAAHIIQGRIPVLPPVAR
ncbi:MAG: hypothetical protein R6V84_14375 [Desulfobacterales bacterium]